MRMIVALVTMVVLAGVADAQPSQTPVYSQPPPTYGTPTYGYGYSQPAMNVRLTVDEQWLLERGYISDGETMGGGVVALLFGWGLGHVVQGRWSQKGYIFTAGEGISGAVMVYAMVGLMGDCFEGCSEQREDRYVTLLAASAIAAGVFRIWEIYDAFAGPGEHNARLTQLRVRLGLPQPLYTRITPYIAPSRDRDGGGVAGISLRF